MKKVVVLSGAGISAESGIKTFRDHDGLWEGHDVMEVASIEGYLKNKQLVLDFYNQRRKQLQEVFPNEGHRALVDLETKFDTVIVTQNVDDLHERAGSSRIIHLHGELLKVRSERDDKKVYSWAKDLNLGDVDASGNQLRPHIVWFGELVPKLDEAIAEIAHADIVIVVGTSLVVYPAAGLMSYAPKDAKIYYVDKNPNKGANVMQFIQYIEDNASTGLRKLVDELLS